MVKHRSIDAEAFEKEVVETLRSDIHIEQHRSGMWSVRDSDDQEYGPFDTQADAEACKEHVVARSAKAFAEKFLRHEQ